MNKNENELDILIDKKERELRQKQKKYSELEAEINEMQSQMCELEQEIDHLEREISKLQKIAKEKKLKALDADMDSNRFLLDFIKASKFCDKDSEIDGNICSYVHIKDNVLFAVNGYMACEIKTVDAPIQDGFIKWDIRKDFEKEAVKENWEMLDIGKYFLNVQNKNFILTDKREFENFIVERIEEKMVSMTIIKLFDITLILNSGFLDTALEIFENNESFKVYDPENELNPLLLENEKKRILILPIRIVGRE